MVHVTTTGPLFEGRLDVRRAAREGIARGIEHGAEFLRRQLQARRRYSTPKYGHAAQSVRTRLSGTGDETVGRAFIGGQAAFLSNWLEYGTRAHPIPKIRIRERRTGRGIRRTVTRDVPTLAIPVAGGLIFRASANHRGARGFQVFSRSQAELDRVAPEILRQVLAEHGIG